MPRTKTAPKITHARPYRPYDTPVIPLATFKEIVKEVAAEVREEPKFSKKAFDALRAISEDYITGVMRIANDIAAKDAREVVSKNDFQLAVVEEKRRKQQRKREYKKACAEARRIHREEMTTQPPLEAWEWETNPKVVDLADQLGSVNFATST